MRENESPFRESENKILGMLLSQLESVMCKSRASVVVKKMIVKFNKLKMKIILNKF